MSETCWTITELLILPILKKFKIMTSTTDRRIDWIDPIYFPKHGSASYASYGSGHVRPLLALSRPHGDFEIDLTTFKVGMPVLCRYIVDNKSQGWFQGIIHRINCNTADVDYDDGDYDYNVSLKNLRHLGVPNKRKFTVKPLPAPEAIVLSIPHAYEAIAHAHGLIKRIKCQLNKTQSFTPEQSSLYVSSDDEVEFIGESLCSTRGSNERPIILY